MNALDEAKFGITGKHIALIASVSRHFGPKTFRHHQTSAEVPGQFGTDLSRPSATFFATISHREERFNITRYYY